MKKFLTVALSTICVACFSLFFVGCNNENDNNNSNNEQIVAIYNTYVAYAESNGETPLSYEDWFASIKGEKGETGANGVDGVSPKLQINATTNMWEISYDNGETWTSLNVKATGSDGINGTNGQDGQDGKDGEDGITPTIEIIDGYWYINGENTGVIAEGKDGVNGTNGTTPTIEINSDGYWVINGVVTEYKAVGKDGTNGVNGTNGEDGANGKSAYELYLQAHPEYTKSEQEWLDDLINGRLGKKETYTVSFNTKLDDNHVGTAIVSQEITENGKITKPNTPVLLGYEFLGWYYEDTDEPWSFIGYSVTENMTLTAKWNILEEMQDYTFISTDTDCTITGLNNITAIEVLIPSCVTTIGMGSFENYTSLTSVTMGNGVTSIGDFAFGGCNSLKSIEIPNSVTNIGTNAFSSCDLLASIEIPGSVKNVGNYTFSYCRSLSSVTIGNGVTSIGVQAFNECDSLTNIEIPNSVTSIESSAFSGCDSLSSVTIGNGVTSIGSSPFHGCTSLTSITVDDNNVNYVDIDGNLYKFNNDGITLTLFQYAIGKKDISFNVPYAVTSIGHCAFEGCDSLTSVTIGNGVTSIGLRAFNECDSLTNIEIPNSVTSIGGSAFSGCDSLSSIKFNGTVVEWNAITKPSSWNGDIQATFVQCTDGQVAI